MTLTLRWSEIALAAQAGIYRNISALRDHRPLEHGRTNAWDQHIHGAIAEYAVAKTLNRHWSPAIGFLDTHSGDLPNIQVKSTTRQNGSLIVRTQDDPSFPFILVILNLPHLTIPGWIAGQNAKQSQFWRKLDPANGIHQAAFFIPQSHLSPIDSLQI